MLSFDNLQTGHSYVLRNFGEEICFMVMDKISESECIVKQLDTLETFPLSDLVKYGKGADYELHEI